MKRCTLPVLALVLALSLFFVGATPVAAAGPDSAGASGLVVDLAFEQSGDWAIKLGSADLGLNSRNIQSLTTRFGLGFPAPVIDPAMIRMVTDFDVQNLALIKEGDRTTILINGAPASALRISDEALTALTDEFAPELEAMAAWFNQANVTIVAHFPPKAGSATYALDLGQRMVEAPAMTAANVIDLGATMSPDGQLISVAGLAPSDLGIPAMAFDVSWLKQFGIDQIDFSLNGGGAKVLANGQEWIALDLDMDYVVESVPQYSAAAGFTLGAAEMQMVNLAASWLKDTNVHVGAYIADAPKDQLPVVTIGRPVLVEVKNAGLYVEGFNTGFALDAMTLSYIEDLGTAAVAWDGAQRQLRMTIDNKPMPAIVPDADFITTVGTVTIGDVLPWGLIDSVLSNTSLAAELVYEDHERSDPEKLAYAVAISDPAAPLMLDLKVSRRDGRLAAWGEAIPINMVGMDLNSTVLFFVNQLGADVTKVNLNIGPAGLAFGINGSNLRLVWDAASRKNVLDLALGIGAEQFNLPAAATTGIVRWGIETAVITANQFDVGIAIELTDEEIPVGSIESLVRSFF